MPLQIVAKTILNKKKKPDEWFLDEYTLNPYSSCSFNCLYCYIRGSKYGIHMEKTLAVKTNAVELLDKQLGNLAKKNKYGVIVLASATEPYLQVEAELKLTQQLLQVILKHRFPVHVVTKSDLVLRDTDLLTQIDEQAILPEHVRLKTKRGAFVTFSFSTIDDVVARQFEPGATPPSQRLAALQTVVAQKFHSGVSLMPLLPFISDSDQELEKMFVAFKQAGARYVMPASLTLFGSGPSDSGTLMFRAIHKYYPHLLKQYLALFANGNYIDAGYARALREKTKWFLKEYGFRDRLV